MLTSTIRATSRREATAYLQGDVLGNAPRSAFRLASIVFTDAPVPQRLDMAEYPADVAFVSVYTCAALSSGNPYQHFNDTVNQAVTNETRKKQEIEVLR